MSNFIIGVLATLTGSILIVLISYLSKSGRKILTRALGKLIDIDIVATYPSSRHAQDSVIQSLNKAKSVKLYMGRGNELQRETFDSLLSNPKKTESVQLLLPATKVSSECTNWALSREKEVMKFDSVFKEGILLKQIDTVVDFVSHVFSNHENFELRRFNTPHLGKIILTEHDAYYYYMATASHGRENTMYKVLSGSNTYSHLNRVFETIWNESNAV
ncbi:hypothetical protein [Roseivirga sp.]|uniref:hypothetical protein n=1 Tax=Roseivirga sp. TaxID=1964215 RepID=UPI002B271E39|nr:hypothetical protein [Roseivirga sp.]